jgi:hypothetical protein
MKILRLLLTLGVMAAFLTSQRPEVTAEVFDRSDRSHEAAPFMPALVTVLVPRPGH